MAKNAEAVAGFRPGQRFQADGRDGGKGWVRYAGPVVVPPAAEGKKAKTRYFVGVEWDEAGRGKNDGSTGGSRYFECAPGMGSFVHPQRVTAGVSVFGAIDAKYRSEFDAADAQRSLLAQNEPGGRTFEVPVVFAGHEETHERLRDVGRLAHVVLNDAGVLGLADEGEEQQAAVARLKELLPSCTELDLGNNLVTAWDDVAAVAEALPLVELRLSSNQLGPELPVPRFAEGALFNRLQRLFLNAVPDAWNQAARLDAAGALPALVELHACVNGLTGLGPGDGPVAGFARLEFLNLTGNRLAEWSEVERLRLLPRLRRLMLNDNSLRELRYPPARDGEPVPFAALEWVSVRDNEVESWSSVDRLNDFPALREIGMLRNPVSRHQSERETRIEVVARVRGLQVMNHSEVNRRERSDAEKLYLKRCAQEALDKGAEAADPAVHPRYLELVKEYGYPAGVKSKAKAQPALKGRLVEVRVYDGSADDEAASKTKKVPKTLTVGNLKALVMRLFKVPPPRQELVLLHDDGAEPTPLDDSIKQLTYYNIEGEARILLRRL